MSKKQVETTMQTETMKDVTQNVNSTNVEATENKVEESNESFDTLYTSLVNELSTAYSTIKKVKAQFRTLEKMHKTDMKTNYRTKKSNPNAQNNQSGFNKPAPVPQSVVNFFNLNPSEQLPRTRITKLIYGYVKDNNLQDEKDRRYINPNPELRKLFELGDDEQISFYNIQTHIKKLYRPT